MKRLYLILLSSILIFFVIQYNDNVYYNQVYDYLLVKKIPFKKIIHKEHKNVFQTRGMVSKKGLLVFYEDIPIKMNFYRYINDKVEGRVAKNIYNWKVNKLKPDEYQRYKYIFLYRRNNIIICIESPEGLYHYGENLFFMLKENNIL
jgi:hypothetical protein